MAGYPSASDFAPTGARGGFIASPGNDSPTQKTFRAADQQTLTPVSIHMLWTAHQGTDEVFRVDGQPLVQVTFIGKIVQCDASNSTNVAYKIDDGTGIMDVKVWLENDDTGLTQAPQAEKVGTYVRVYGHLRQWQKSLNVVAFRMRPVDNSNEITFHLLEVIRVHLHNTKGALPSASAGTDHTPIKPPLTLPGPTPPHANVRDSFGAPLPEVQADIMQAIRSAPSPDMGAARGMIISALSHKWAAPVIAQNIQLLLNDALIFTTIDNDHFNAGEF